LPDFDLECLFICPNRELADAFLKTVPALRTFQVLTDLKSYPTEQALEMRLRQMNPQLVLLDVATDAVASGTIIEYIVRSRPGTQVIGLHTSNDSEAILSSLRRGAIEFLYAPFDPAIQREAISRIRRLRKPTQVEEREPGHVISFTSAKPGAGASTLAAHMAMALERESSGRVLLIDADMAGGTQAIAGPESASLEAVLNGTAGVNWPRHTVKSGPIEVLPAPVLPPSEAPNLARLNEVLETARHTYDWTVVDLPAMFERLSLLALAEADAYYMVTGADLPSLHLARRAVALLQTSGVARDRVRVIVNGISKRDGLAPADLAKILSGPVEAMMPRDPSTNQAADSEFGKAMTSLMTKVKAAAAAAREAAAPAH
jgi:pilus assembly protein CpaE